MEKDLFINIFKHTPSKEKKPLENYCTEIFVYILRQLIEIKDTLAFDLLALFGYINIKKEDLSHIKIVTQKTHYVNGKPVKPDIIISLRNKINIIEVKVNSGVRKYYLTKKKNINQIDLYKKIDKINDVFLLSKYSFFDYSLKNRILWSQIHLILRNSNNEITRNFISFLEENGMESNIVENGAENGIKSIYALATLLEKSFENVLPNIYELKPEIEWEYFGYYIKKNNESIAWIGQYKEFSDYLVFQPLGKRIIKEAKKINEKMELLGDSENIFSKIEIKKITCLNNETQQIKVIQKWYNEIFKVLL